MGGQVVDTLALCFSFPVQSAEGVDHTAFGAPSKRTRKYLSGVQISTNEKYRERQYKKKKRRTYGRFEG